MHNEIAWSPITRYVRYEMGYELEYVRIFQCKIDLY